MVYAKRVATRSTALWVLLATCFWAGRANDVWAQPESTTQPPTVSQPPQPGDSDSATPMTDQDVQPAPRRTSTRRTSRSQQLAGYRLASIPKMFGDLFGGGGRFVGQPPVGMNPGEPVLVTDLPMAAIYRRSKLAENNNVLPTDRVFFTYNHFSNALSMSGLNSGPAMSDVDVFTLGAEKMFCDAGSIELRLPLMNDYRAGAINQAVTGGNVGNLSIILKHLVGVRENHVWGVGVAIDLPTGSDVDVAINSDQFTVKNDAVHFLPFVAAAGAIGDHSFWNASAQVDLASQGNRIVGPTIPPGLRFNLQNLFYADVSFGHWLARNPAARHVNGIAGIVELHYTSAMQDSDNVAFPQGAILNTDNRFDVLNLSSGLHFEIHDRTTLRIMAVAPLRSRDDQRFFDAEIAVQLNRYY